MYRLSPFGAIKVRLLEPDFEPFLLDPFFEAPFFVAIVFSFEEKFKPYVPNQQQRP
jgi:hypothetical protein